MKRRGWIALAAACLAAAGACLFTALQPPIYRGHVELVVTRGNEPLDPRSRRERADAAALRELVKTHVLAANVVAGLKLRESPDTLLTRLSVSTPQAAILRIAVADRRRAQALRIASEVGLVFTQLVQARFGARGSASPLRLTVWDPPHAERASPTPRIAESGLLAALVGGLAGFALAGIRRRPGAELERPHVELIRPVPQPEPERIRPLPQPKPEPLPEPKPELPPAAVVSISGNPAGNVLALDRLVEQRAPEFPDRAEEWRYYVVYLRDFAGPDGSLPASLAGLVADVFADLLLQAA
jgi:capsular polysaccharide biosynthesis protein